MLCKTQEKDPDVICENASTDQPAILCSANTAFFCSTRFSTLSSDCVSW